MFVTVFFIFYFYIFFFYVYLLFYFFCDGTGEGGGDYDKKLYDLCMSRFLYVRCSDSFQFLQTLKVR